MGILAFSLYTSAFEGGGLPRIRTVLCGLRVRCIASMLATLVALCKERDAKAESAVPIPNRDETLAGTGVRVAKNGSVG
jgi:hypothetical protein